MGIEEGKCVGGGGEGARGQGPRNRGGKERGRGGGGRRGKKRGVGKEGGVVTLGSAIAAPLMSCHVSGTACSICPFGKTPHGITPRLHTAASLALTCLWPGLLNHTSSSDSICIRLPLLKGKQGPVNCNE